MRTAYDAERFEIVDCRAAGAYEEMKQEVLEGLSAKQKTLPCKYFYDSRGSMLFEQICRLPEYYQTRTELAILRKNARAIMKELKEGSLIDLGSGANWKIRHLLDAADGLRRRIRYVPVDVCESTLIGATEELLCLYPDLSVCALVADFHRQTERIASAENKLITFFGGTIGNFRKEEMTAFLRKIASVMNRSDRLLAGIDMIKQKKLLEAAYNDSQGITAQFNKNILAVLNRELNAGFNLAAFEHLAFYNEESECIEMHLKASRDLFVEIGDLDIQVNMKKGETIFTETSRKFSRKKAEEMSAEAGLRISRWFADARKWFALVELKRS